MKDISSSTKETLLKLQKNEITEYYIYKRLARRMKGKNQKVLLKIAEDERRHLYGYCLPNNGDPPGSPLFHSAKRLPCTALGAL